MHSARPKYSRRGFLAAVGALAAGSVFATQTLATKSVPAPKPGAAAFRLSVLTDEIAQDFGRACEIASTQMGVGCVDLRAMWGKSIIDLDDKQLAEAKAILSRFNLRVGCIAGPLFKVDWLGAPLSKFSSTRDASKIELAFKRQEQVLSRSIELARIFETDQIRCFDFMRLDDPKPYREAIDQKLREAAEKAARHNLVLLLENEHACNTATAAESVRTLRAVPAKNFQLIWDPANAFFAGENPFPEGYRLLPNERIGLVHLKDAVRKPDGKKNEFACMGRGQIDYVGQFRALMQDGFKGSLVLETHWKGAGTTEESSLQSMAGLKELLKRAGALQ